jgi:hypothetical protein
MVKSSMIIDEDTNSSLLPIRENQYPGDEETQQENNGSMSSEEVERR